MRHAVGEQRVDAGPGGEDLHGRDAARRRVAVARGEHVAAHLFATRANVAETGHANSVAIGEIPCNRFPDHQRPVLGREGRLRVRRRPARRSARRSRASSRRSACRADSGRAAYLQRARTARRRRRCLRARPRVWRRRQAVWIASSSETGMTSSISSRLSTGGTKPAPMPWMRCGPALSPESTAEPLRLDGDHLQLRVDALAQVLADAGDRARPCRRPPRARRRGRRAPRSISGPVVRRWASGLAGLENWSGRNTSRLARHRARRLDGLAHAAERLGDVDPGAVEAQQALALAAHPLGQRQDEVIALGGADERERDAGVAAGRLDDRRAAGLDAPLGLGRLDHRDADPVLDAATRVERLELGEQLDARVGRRRALEHPGQADQRRIPDELRNVDRDSSHMPPTIVPARPPRLAAAPRARRRLRAPHAAQ